MSLDKEVAEWLDSIGMVWGEEGNVWYLPDKDGPVIQMSYYAATFFYTAIKQAELKALNNLVDNSDCLEDGCGLDAELLRHNVLNRISELKDQLNNSNKEDE